MASKRKLEALESGVDAVYSETQLIQIDNINPVSSPNKLPTGYSGKLPIINPILPAVINPPVKAPSKQPTPIPPSKGPTPIPPGKGPSNENGTNTASKSVTTKSSALPNSGFQTESGLLLRFGSPYTGEYNNIYYTNGVISPSQSNNASNNGSTIGSNGITISSTGKEEIASGTIGSSTYQTGNESDN